MFYGDYLTDDQAYVLENQFLPMIRDEKIDAVVLSGDVYDRSLPPADAVGLFDEIATKITAELKVPFLLISGNHDSAARLSFGSRLLSQQNMFIAGELDKLTGPVTLSDEWGPVVFVPVPFAEPAVVRHFLQDDSVTDHQSALQKLCQLQSKGLTAGARSICIAHAFVAGGTVSDSERPLSVGGTDMVDAAAFADFSYTALGHLHGPQQAGNPQVRYSGSLLKYSFSEATQRKGAVLVDLPADGQVTTTFLPFAPQHDVRILEGTFDDIINADDAHQEDFVMARLSDKTPILDGMAKLRRKYPRALALETPNRELADNAADRSFDVQHTSDQQMFESFVERMRPDQRLSTEEKACIEELWQLAAKEGDRS